MLLLCILVCCNLQQKKRLTPAFLLLSHCAVKRSARPSSCPRVCRGGFCGVYMHTYTPTCVYTYTHVCAMNTCTHAHTLACKYDAEIQYANQRALYHCHSMMTENTWSCACRLIRDLPKLYEGQLVCVTGMGFGVELHVIAPPPPNTTCFLPQQKSHVIGPSS
jgi:hypothetical protein